MTRQFAEELESRRLFSSVGPATVFDGAVRTDEKFIFQDFTKFKKDGLKSDAAMAKDGKQIRASNLTQAPSAKTELLTFFGALVQADRLLVGDHLTESSPVNADEKAILAEQKKLSHDKKNATAETADQAQLLADRKQVQADLDNEIQARITDRENIFNQVLNEASTLVGEIQADTQAAPKLVAAEQKLSTDAQNCGTSLSTDLQQVGTDATQMDTDLTASQSQQ